MNRRKFILTGTTATALACLTSRTHAAMQCSPYDPWGIQVCTAGIQSQHMDAFYDPQWQSQWCWAACIAMVFAYYGFPVDQRRIVADTWGGIRNLPAQAHQILVNLNRPWISDNNRPFRVSATSYMSNAMTAAQDLAQDMPLIIGSGSHAMLLSAVTYRRHISGNGELVSATVRDPWPGRGQRLMLPQEIRATHFLARIRLFPA